MFIGVLFEVEYAGTFLEQNVWRVLESGDSGASWVEVCPLSSRLGSFGEHFELSHWGSSGKAVWHILKTPQTLFRLEYRYMQML